MADEHDPIIPFVIPEKPEHEPLPLELDRDRSKKRCDHRESWIDPEARTLTCQDCGVALDPIAYLVNFAQYSRRLDSRIAEIRECERKNREIEQRKLEEKKAKVPEVLARIKPGAILMVKHDASGGLGYAGSFRCVAKSVGSDVLTVGYDYADGEQEVPIESIVSIRVIRKAR